jgi:DNA-binding transcriptional ArsR family regulator
MTAPAGDQPGDASPTVMLSGSCRPLRRSLRPIAWPVLEEVALDAEAVQGRVVARTSARQIADHLGIDPGTAAAALRTLRERGLIRSFREQGAAGRFGLSVYELAAVDGLRLVPPCVDRPHMAPPEVASPGLAKPAMASLCLEPSGSPWKTADVDDGHRADGRSRRPQASQMPPGESVQCPGQEAFDLGMGAP